LFAAGALRIVFDANGELTVARVAGTELGVFIACAKSSDGLATFAAIRRASSLLSS
jgi:hypothetical protein